VVNRECGFDCAGECADRECHSLRELSGAAFGAVSCYGTCSGRCAGRLEVDAAPLELPPSPRDVKPDRHTRATVRSRELFFERSEEQRASYETYEVSCAVGCFVSHGAETTGGPADCYGSCLGICYGAATYQDVEAPTSRGYK